MGAEQRFLSRFMEVVHTNYRDAFVYKIPDAPFTGNKPFDVILDHGRVFYIEGKVLEANRKSFSVGSLFRPHQIRILHQLQILHSSDYTCAWGMVGKPRDQVFLIPAADLAQASAALKPLNLHDYTRRSLREAAQFFCEDQGKPINGNTTKCHPTIRRERLSNE